MKNLFRLKWAGVLGVILLLAGARAQVSQAAEETLNNASIVELQKLGLGDGVLLEKIKTSKCDFDTSLGGLKQLKEYGFCPGITGGHHRFFTFGIKGK